MENHALFENTGIKGTVKQNRKEESWRFWLREGNQYMKAGSGGKGRFNNTLRYNLLAMAFEKFVMAMLSYHMSLPLNHTFTDLIEALEKFHPLDLETKAVLLELEKKQEICSFEDVVTADVTDGDIRLMTETIGRFEVMAMDICPPDQAPVFLPMDARPDC